MSLLNICCETSKGVQGTTERGMPRKKIISFTPQYYTTAPLDIHPVLTSLKALPIDGVLLDFKWTSPTFGFSTVQKTWMYSDLIQYSDLTTQIASFNALDWGTLNENFIRMRLQPGVDNTVEFWNDPAMISAAAHNMGVVAKAAKAIGAKGIMWDLEAYSTDIQHRMLYSTALKAGFSLAERKLQVRAGMAAIAKELWENYPEAIVFMLFGYEQTYNSAYYDLLPSAIDGICDSLPFTKGTDQYQGVPQLINGLEDCYFTNNEPDFDYVFETKAFEAHRAAGGTWHPQYVKSISMSCGIWLDRMDTAPWNTFSASAPFDKNYYDPTIPRLRHASWQQQVEKALKYSDAYVWIYVEASGTGLVGEAADYHAATLAAINAANMSRTRYNRRVLAVVSNAQKAAANAACATLGLPPLFYIPLIDKTDAVGTATKYWMANLTISEATYRAIKVVVGASASITWSPQGAYNIRDVIDVWVHGQGKRLAVGTEPESDLTDYFLLTSGDNIVFEDASNFLLVD